MVGRRHLVGLVVALLVVASTAVVAVRVADPFPGEGARPLDTTAPSGEVAVRALEQTERGDYTVTEWRSEWLDGSGPRRGNLHLVRRLQVSNTHGRLRYNISYFDESFTILYGNGHCRWGRVKNPVDSFTSDWSAECPYLARQRFVVGLFEGRHVANATPTVVTRNRSTLVLRIADTETADAIAPVGVDTDERTARLTMYVDRDAGHLRRLVFESRNRTNASDRLRSVFVFRDWGDTRVRRPAGVPYTFEEFLLDVMDLGRTAPDRR